MPTKGAATTVQFTVWDTANNVGKTGDVANLTLRRIVNTTAYTITGSPVEVDATNAPGVYAIALTAAENAGDLMGVVGKSSTAKVVVIPTFWANEEIWAESVRSLTDRTDFVLSTAGVAAVQSGLATSANQTTILNRLGAWTGTGVNTILGAFKALLSKVASAPSDIGGTFDPATDSTEAIRDAAYTGGAVSSVTAPVTVGTNNDKADYALSAAAVAAVQAGLATAAAVAALPTSSANAAAIAAYDLASLEAGAKTATTLGGMIAIIRAVAAGKFSLSGTTMTVYEVDGTTVLATFTVASDYSTRTAPA